MRQSSRIAVIVVALAVSSLDVAAGRRSPPPTPMESPGRPLAEQLDRGFTTMAVETTLASFTFDSGSGAPDAQGWTTVDRTAQLGAFFHVDDFADLGGGAWIPITGTKSLWCGVRPCTSPSMDDLCSYATAPGYGNNWDQRFVSTSFSVTGDVSITFDLRYDVEPVYDSVNLDYSVAPGTWTTWATFDGLGSQSVQRTISSLDHSGSIRFRFRVVSDDIYSDEDGARPSNGAAIIDNVTISDASGIVDFQDFESEPSGLPFTLDFDWFATTRGQYGNHTALFDGDAVLQEDSSITNSTNLWGFFNGSSANYACGGHPEQAVVPFSRMVDGYPAYIENEVRSPEIPYLGVAPGSPVRLEFDVYADLPFDNFVFYQFRVRSKVSGVWRQWRSNGIVYYNAEKEWLRHKATLTNIVEAGATSIQVAVGVKDMCESWCGTVGSGNCHSQAPLIDNVSVVVSHDAFVVTNTNDSGPGSLRAAITEVNSSLHGGVIRFDIPGSGPFDITLSSALPAIVKTAVLDGRTQPGYSGEALVRLVVLSTGPASILELNAPSSQVLDLAMMHPGFDPTGTGISINSDHCVVRGCIIAQCGTGVVIAGSDNEVGGTADGDGNTIFLMYGDGIQVPSIGAHRNRILGNSVVAVGGLGIDLPPDGVNPNDLGDTDIELQNYPVLTSASAGPYSTTIGGNLSSTPNTIFRVEFFANEACNPSGYGDGQTFIGFSYVFTDGGGNATVDEYLAAPVPTGSRITATAAGPFGYTSEFSNCVLSINTPIGSNVVAQPIDEATGIRTVTITFDQVTGSGNTSLVIGDTGPPLPGTFDLGDGNYYELATTATFFGDFEACIIYDEASLVVPEANLRLLHWVDDGEQALWVDITTSLDVVGNVVCGTTNHFSPFVLAASAPTAVGDPPVPQAFALRPNVPNPFNPTTTIFYDVPAGGANVTIRIYDVAGRLVRTLVDEQRPAGEHRAVWDGRNSSGNVVSTGVYFYRMVSGSFVAARRMVLLK